MPSLSSLKIWQKVVFNHSVPHLLMADNYWLLELQTHWWPSSSHIYHVYVVISLYVGVLDVMIIHNSGIRFNALMLGVLWPVVHITQHPEPMYPAVANTSSNSCLGDVCQSQLWPMGSSHTLSHSINSNRYLTQMCHAYPDIAFILNWHNSRGNSFPPV